jgi:predicted small secreted protein
MRAIFAIMLVVGGFALAACNTTEGLGKDTQAAGRAVERAADRNK